MDTDWMRERLERYISAADQYIASPRSPSGFGRMGDQWMDQLRREEGTVKRIFKALDAELDFNVDTIGGEHDARAAAMRALGILQDRDEVAVRLRPDAPQLSADRLHPWVWDAAHTFWESGHRAVAVQQAAKSINTHLQQKVDRRDVSDDQLVREAFTENPPAVGKPRLRVPGEPSDLTVQSIQRGCMSLGLGCFQAIRNPVAHTEDEMPEQEALERLAALSVFARLADQSTVVHAEE